MLDVDIRFEGRRQMVDSGNSFGLSIPKKLADQLIRLDRANRIGSSQTTLADGSVQSVETIAVHRITVDGRMLHDVVASVSPNEKAPILLGLAALNRLGAWHFTDEVGSSSPGSPTDAPSPDPRRVGAADYLAGQR